MAFMCLQKKMAGQKPAYGTEEFYREMYPGMPDDRIYPLLVVAAQNPGAHPKELKSLLKKKCRHLASQSEAS